MKALLAMMDLERRWPKSDPALEQGARYAARRRGDPTLQSLAQGACMAIEDAVCLAETIDLSDGDFEDAFRRYESARYLRTARVQFESRYLWENFYHLGGTEGEVARKSWAGRSEQDVFQCLAWLYDGFVLPEKQGKG
jgi:hypothetical protein